MDFGRSRPHQGPLRRMEGADAFRWHVFVHHFTPCEGWSEQAFAFRAGFHAHGPARIGFVQDLGGGDLPGGDVLDFHGPTGRHVAGFHPVVDDGAVQPEAAGDFGLTAEQGDETFSAIHGARA